MRERARTRELAVYDFCAGTDSRAYEHLGAHRAGEGRYVFRFYAPTARCVSLIGDFLPDGACAMSREADGIWTAVITPHITPEGMAYAYRADGIDVSDPFARGGLSESGETGFVCTVQSHRWEDELWMRERARRAPCADRPLHLYRVHLSSFATREGRSCLSADDCLNYRALGDLLARYVADMGYTHVRLMPLTDHRPARRGALPEGLFSPLLRHGSPDDLRAMIDRLHRAGIGVIMDLPQILTDGLPSAIQQSFWLSATVFWLREFHLDGICPQGIGALDADALRAYCAAVHSACPGALLMSEESDGEEGFDLAVHPRLEEDTRRALGAADAWWPPARDRLMLTMRETATPGAAVLQPPTHLFDGREAGYLRRFAAARLILTYRMAHPGKKQMFMGDELGQKRPWDSTVPPDWFLRELPTHAAFWTYVRALNHFYRSEPRLWENERAEWVDTGVTSVVMLCRADAAGNMLAALLNFSDEEKTVRLREDRWRMGARAVFGGDVPACEMRMPASADGHPEIRLPPLGAFFIEPMREERRAAHQFLLTPD